MSARRTQKLAKNRHPRQRPTSPFHAQKPIQTTHPVNGDALIFTITPPTPQSWWRALRHATADPTLVRPWDQEHESRIAVVCPPLDEHPGVIGAINAAVQASNRDYDEELALQQDSAIRVKNDEAERDQYHSDIRRAIDARFDHRRGSATQSAIWQPPATDKPDDGG